MGGVSHLVVANDRLVGLVHRRVVAFHAENHDMIGRFEVGHLSLLGGLVLIAALVVMGQRSVDSLSPRRRLMSLVIRSLFLSTLIGALADIRLWTETRRKAVIWLVDVSDSVGNAAVAAFGDFYQSRQVAAGFD